MKPFRTAAAALLLAAGAAQAQGPDARVLPRGMLEVRVLGIFSGYDERFGGGDALGGAFETLLQPRAEALTAPELGPLRTRLNTFFAATGTPVETASLGGGSVRALLSGDTRDVPITAALGLTSRLTVEATLPVTRRQTSVRGIFLEDGTIGLNPNVELNGQLLSRVDTSFRALGRSPFLPVQGTDAATALRQRLNARSAGAGDSLALPTRGVSIQELVADATRAGRLTPQELDALTRRTAGSGYQLGDVELGARFRVAGTAPAWAVPDDSTFVRGFRAVLGARVRLPTGKLGNTLFLLEEPGLRGHFGVAGDVAGDWFPSRRWWVTGAADAQLLLGANVTRLAFSAENPFPDTTQTRVLRREPGMRIGASLTPRYRLTNELSFAAQYRLEIAGATTYSGEGSELLGPIELIGGRTAHRFGLGASYTTVGAYAAGRAPFPAEVSLLYGRTVAGTGGAPADTRLELGVRAYYPALWRPRRAATPTPPPAPADSARPAPPR
ncbi:MAG TPA: hypothetical protein VF647_19525 [Longimicrobium sp.]|jgi:hypothetical protein